MRDQEIIGLWEAYQQVYSQPQEEVEQLDEGFQRNPEKGEKEDRSSEAIPGQAPRKMPPRGHKDREAFEKWYAKNVREDFDLFDYLLEYLVAEGYADTNKAALAIMANMSDEWRQSIVEDQPSPAYATQGGQTYRDYNNDGKSASQIAREKRMKEFSLKRGDILRGV